MRHRGIMLVAACVLALVVSGCGSTSKPVAIAGTVTPTPTSVPATTLPPAQLGKFITTGRGPVPPAKNAWFGAYADPYNQTAAQKVAALQSFQQVAGRAAVIVHSFHPWGDAIPSEFDYDIVKDHQIDLLSWAGTDTRSIESGVYDAQIRRTAQAIKTMDAPILLRFRWEMDRPNLAASVHSAADYIAAWKRVRSIFTQVGATNAGFVWCPLATGFASGVAQQYYPGDDQVDWICADVYPGPAMPSFANIMAPVMQFASQHHRPVMIGELGVTPTATRGQWFSQVRAVIAAQPQIKAMVYFYSAHRSQPNHNYTFVGDPSDLSAFRALIDSPALSAPPPDSP
jgi:hypothetical protein